MDNFENSISFKINHSLLKCIIPDFKSRLSIKNHSLDIVGIIHEFIKSDSSFISRSTTDRTNSSCLRILSGSNSDNSFFDKIIPHLTSNLSGDHFVFQCISIKLFKGFNCIKKLRVVENFYFLCTM